MTALKGRVLIIAGSDSSGGAGIQADIKAVSACGAYAATAITALTAQNTVTVSAIHDVPPDFVTEQMRMVLSDIGADAIKTGMLHRADVIEAVADALDQWAPDVPLVVDPVMVATSGARLLEPEAESALRRLLIPRAALITPNIPEAEVLTGKAIRDWTEMADAAKALLALGPKAVLIKGGHLDSDTVHDVLVGPNTITRFRSGRIDSRNTHGTGCTLASAIAARLAQKAPIAQAVEDALSYVQQAIRTAPGFGSGHGPLNHMHGLPDRKADPMELPLYQIDAFTDRVFAGNPAAVCPLTEWMDDDILQRIAAENNLSETAFFVAQPEKGPNHFHLRWFTPTDEVDLCGHATLASAYVVFNDLMPDLTTVFFETRSGTLVVERGEEGRLSMDFPALPPHPIENAGVLMDRLGEALGKRPLDLQRAVNLLAVFETEDDVRRLRYGPGLAEALIEADAWGLIVTGPARDNCPYDFVSRFFAPLKGVPEDPVTGSAHCTLTPYWAQRLGKTELQGFQASVRGGLVTCTANPNGQTDRVGLSGHCAPYLKGTITV